MDDLEPKPLAAAEWSLLKAPPAVAEYYEVLGRFIRIAGNDPAILERFRRLYAPLYRDRVAARAVLEIRFYYDGSTFLVAQGEAGFRFSHPSMAEQPAMIFTRLIMEACTDFLLVHAAALSCAGHGVVLAGSSGLGKSTLAAHLAVRGHGFFSDEIAAIAPATGCLHPFPLRIGLRPGPGQRLAGQAEAVAQDVLDDPKLLVDIVSLSGRPPAVPCPARAVILLTTRAAPEVQTVKKRAGRVKAWFSVDTPALRESVSAVPGVAGCVWTPEGLFTTVVMQAADLPAAIPALRAAAQAQGGELAMVQHEDFERVNHQEAPAWLPLPVSAGVLELVKRIPASFRSRLVQERYGGQASSLVLALSAALAKARFYKLTPGRLEEMLDLVEAMAAGRAGGAGGS